jgi:hypothetical protein
MINPNSAIAMPLNMVVDRVERCSESSKTAPAAGWEKQPGPTFPFRVP